MRFIVTGACGFLGSHLCERLIRYHGHEVIGIDNGIIGKECNVSKIVGNPLFRLEWMDVCHDFDVGKVDGIFHLASPTAPAETYKHSEMTLNVNTKATINLLSLAEKHSAKFLFASSVKVHDRVNFGATYIQGKILGEKFCEASGFSKVARMGNVYGPKMAHDDSRVIPTFCRNIRDNKPLAVWGDGSQIDSFCYVDDIIHALIKLMDSDYTGVFELGSPQPITIHSLAVETIAALDSKSPIIFEQPGGASVVVCNNAPYANNRTCAALNGKMRKVPDISLARNYLRWQPTTPLSDGIKKTFEYYCNLKEN